MRRECRGLVVDARTGVVLARRFHKFFNVAEMPEVSLDELARKVASCRSACVAEKLDGSLASPVLLPSESGRSRELRWLTRSTVCDELEAFVSVSQHQQHQQHQQQPVANGLEPDPQPASSNQYAAFARRWLELGWTPLFEWCTPTVTVGVVSHSRPTLILLALRNNIDGRYMQSAELQSAGAAYGVPCAQQQAAMTSLLCVGSGSVGGHGVGSSESNMGVQAILQELISTVSTWPAGKEGVVVRLTSGTQESPVETMFKVKTRWCVQSFIRDATMVARHTLLIAF